MKIDSTHPCKIFPCFRSESPNDVTNLIRDQLLFSSVCLERKTSEMFSLWKDFFNGSLVPNEACFETTLEGLTTRLNDLITMSAVGSKNGLAHSGHHYVRTHHMFSRILNLRNLNFFKEICCLLWTVLNGFSFKN